MDTQTDKLLHNSLRLVEKPLPVIDHVQLGVVEVLQVDHDDILEVSYTVMLEQFHLDLKQLRMSGPYWKMENYTFIT